MANTLKIIQWNARSAYSNTKSIRQLLDEENFDIAIISETWYKPDYDVRLNGFNIIRKDRPGGKGGVAIFVSNKIPFTVIKFQNNFNDKIEVCGILININGKKLSVMSLYRPPNIKATVTDYVNIFKQMSHSVVIGGDFNAHHGLWGSSINNHDGSILVDALDYFSNFVVGNNGSATKITAPNIAISAVDITILSSDLVNAYTWNTLCDTYGSDHVPIKISLLEYGIDNTMVYPITKWSTDKANWPLYKVLIEDQFRDLPEFYSTNHMLTFLINAITTAADTACKKKVPFLPNHSKSPPLWADHCTTLSRQRKDIFKKYKHNMTKNDNFIIQKIRCVM